MITHAEHMTPIVKLNWKIPCWSHVLVEKSKAYILVKEITTIVRRGDDEAERQADEKNKKVIFENCTPFTDYISKISNTKIDKYKRFECCYANV